MSEDQITWRPRGGVLVAVEPPPPESAALEAAPQRPRAIDMTACPTCHCKAGERCRTASGNPARRAHSTRLVARFCACGEVLPWHRKFWCDPCYLASLRKAQREYAARRRAKLRRAA